VPYVSAKYVASDPLEPPDAPRQVQAVDDQGLVWSLTEDSQVGDWLRYIEEGGTVEPYVEPEVTEPVPEAYPPVVYDEVNINAAIINLNARVTALEEQMAAKE